MRESFDLTVKTMLKLEKNIEDIKKSTVIRFLKSKNWAEDTSLRSAVRLYERDEENPIEIFFTATDSKHLQNEEVYLALRTISQLYDKDISSLISEIQHITYDLLLSKIPDDHVKNNSIRFHTAFEYVRKIRDFLVASATTEIQDAPFFKRSLKEAVEYADSCRFGHTFPGSFGFMIESPVGLNDAPAFLNIEDGGVPAERKYIERILRGLSSFEDATLADDPTLIVKAERGLSANMCDIMADLIESTEVSNIDISIKLSPEWRSPLDAITRRTFKIRASDIEILKDAAGRMRESEEPREEKIVGRIRRLSSDGNPADTSDLSIRREVEVTWINEDNAPINVRMSLSPDDYLTAVSAHAEGKLVVAVGMLERKGRTFVLGGAANFRVLEI